MIRHSIARWLLGFDPVPRPPKWYEDAEILVVSPEEARQMCQSAETVAVQMYGAALRPVAGEIGVWNGRRLVLASPNRLEADDE